MTRLAFGTDSICRYCHGTGWEEPRSQNSTAALKPCTHCGGSGILVNAVPLARKSDPETSHQAAKDVAPRANTHRAKALAALREAGAEGLNDFELGALLNISQTSIGVRRKELVDAGLVTATGRTRPSPGGSASRVWVAVS